MYVCIASDVKYTIIIITIQNIENSFNLYSYEIK